MSDVDKEFEDAARELAAAEQAFNAHYMRNVATDPVENLKQIVALEGAKGRLFEAKARLTRARRAKYPNSLY